MTTLSRLLATTSLAVALAGAAPALATAQVPTDGSDDPVVTVPSVTVPDLPDLPDVPSDPVDEAPQPDPEPTMDVPDVPAPAAPAAPTFPTTQVWPDDGATQLEPEEPVEPEVPAAPTQPAFPTTSLTLVPGRVARLRTDGRAAVPRSAPKRVRALIRALNEIVGKPYKWGGGHAKLLDRGYDCSGSVSYGLIRTGLLRAPLVSGGFAKAYAAGDGRWVSIYANAGHVYMEVAGLRLDTSSVADPTRQGDGVRWRPAIGRRAGFTARHPLGL